MHYFAIFVKNVILKKTGNRLFLIFLVLISGILLVRCAKQGTPAGGPKDETPPEMVSAIPPDRTIFFNAKKVIISFNEFIQLKDAAKEIFISPPMKVKPLYKVQGKKVLVEFQEELKENSTYTINFGNAITDYTEGNPLVNFEYVFSTGSHIDSLSIQGRVLNAMDLKPEKEILVMVYLDNNDTISLDSLPLMVPPKSASKSTKDGNFRINNLPEGKFKLFALEDLNNNFIFDMPNERIAFLDSLVTITPAEPEAFPADSTDTTQVETSGFQIISEASYTLYLFAETDPVQRLLSKKLITPNLLQYIYKRPVDSVMIEPVEFQPAEEDWYILEFGKLRDTLNIWLKAGLQDTIRVCVSPADTLADTSKFILSSKAGPEKPGRKKETSAKTLNFSPNTKAGHLDFFRDFTLTFAAPVLKADTTRLSIFAPNDTLVPQFEFTDTIRRHGKVNYKWIQDETYLVNFDDSAFMDIGGNYSDSTTLRVKVRMAEDYGILILDVNMTDNKGQTIIQLMTDKDVLLEEKIILASEKIRFGYLLPGNYKLKAIHDLNMNGKWDPGNYREKLLPEMVEYFTLPLSIRANWDQQEEWQLEK
jgi:hypothetical protein